MQVETKYLRLFRAVRLGDDIEGWEVCWLGGWDKNRVVFVVMVKRVTAKPSTACSEQAAHSVLPSVPGLWRCGCGLEKAASKYPLQKPGHEAV